MRVVPSLVALLAVAASAPPAGAEPPQAVLDAMLGDERLTVPLAELMRRAEPAPGEAVKAVEVGRDARSSHHVVGLRRGEGETLHRHDRHDLVVVMLRGHGSMRLGDETRPVGEGSLLYVPRGTAHAFTNRSGATAFAYTLYLPAFDGSDRVRIEENAGR